MSLLDQQRHVWRRLRRSPMFGVIAVVTLAVGIGANAAIFSVINGILLKPLPYTRSDRLIAVWQTAPGLNLKDVNASPATYFAYREESHTFEDIGLWQRETVSVTGRGEPEEIPCLSMTDGTLPLLDVRPFIGRTFSKKDDSPGAPRTTILSYGYWQRKFGGDPHAVGSSVVMDGENREIIGVMPQSFRFLDVRADVLLPLRLDRAKVFIGNFSYQAIARLRDGATLTQATADVARMIPMLVSKFPPAPGMSAHMLEEARLGPNLRALKDDVVGDIGNVLWILMATVGMVLVIAGANVANLLLVRAEGRQQELAVRAALGAGRGRIARELLTESLTLGILGGIFGLGLAAAGLRLLIALAPANVPRLADVAIDGAVVAFTLAVSVVAGLLFGVIPVIKYGGPRIAFTLRQGGRTSSQGRDRHRARSILVIAEVALALVLLISSGLMTRSLLALRQVEPGFTRPEQILTMRVSVPESQARTPDDVVRLYDQARQKMAALPGVELTGLSTSVAMDDNKSFDPIYARDHTYTENQIPALRRYKSIGPGYFAAMGAHLSAGRDYTWTDLYEKRNVMIVSDNLARELWGSPSNALGKQIRESPKGEWREVIGVAADMRDDGVDAKAPTIAYWPVILKSLWGFPESARREVAFVIRSPRARTAALVREAQQAIWSVNPNITVSSIRTVQELFDRSTARTSFTMLMLAIAAAMALLLGVVGIYGVVAYSVSQRTREIGIRIALGSPASAVRGIFVRHALLLTSIGLAFGLAAAAALTRLMTSLLFGVKPLDPLTYVAVSLVLALSAALASYLPARRATRIAPSEALRME